MLRQLYEDLLDKAMALKPGEVLHLRYSDAEARERARWGLYNTIHKARMEARRLYAPEDLAWGKSPWEDLVISREGSQGLALTRTEPGLLPGLVSIEVSRGGRKISPERA